MAGRREDDMWDRELYEDLSKLDPDEAQLVRDALQRADMRHGFGYPKMVRKLVIFATGMG